MRSDDSDPDPDCLLQAVILLPEKEGAEDGESSVSDEEETKSRAGSPSHLNNTGRKGGKARRAEKKKQKQL